MTYISLLLIVPLHICFLFSMESLQKKLCIKQENNISSAKEEILSLKNLSLQKVVLLLENPAYLQHFVDEKSIESLPAELQEDLAHYLEISPRLLALKKLCAKILLIPSYERKIDNIAGIYVKESKIDSSASFAWELYGVNCTKEEYPCCITIDKDILIEKRLEYEPSSPNNNIIADITYNLFYSLQLQQIIISRGDNFPTVSIPLKSFGEAIALSTDDRRLAIKTYDSFLEYDAQKITDYYNAFSQSETYAFLLYAALHPQLQEKYIFYLNRLKELHFPNSIIETTKIILENQVPLKS